VTEFLGSGEEEQIVDCVLRIVSDCDVSPKHSTRNPEELERSHVFQERIGIGSLTLTWEGNPWGKSPEASTQKNLWMEKRPT
jgi:hypothetical protein